jgi:Family of unknown function (DUF5694)
MKSLLFGLLLVGSMAHAKPFDPRDLRGKHVGPPTQVLTLGTVHLVQIGKPVTPAMLAPLLDRLAKFAPQIITHESINGEQCETLARNAAVYPGTWDPYCWGSEEARAATGLTVAEASAQIDKTLNDWPAEPTATQRRRLAALFLAANDRMSAQVQWRYLPPQERKIGDGLDEALVKILTRAGAPSNESYDIAVALAVRLGLQRVYAVDDHTADAVRARAGSGLDPAMEKLYTTIDLPEAIEMKRREAALNTGTDLLSYYRFLNNPKTGRAFVSAEYGGALKQDTPQRFGRQHVAWWEVRNLRMVANVRAAFANRPGARVLNVVGASHKPYYDAYLKMISDVEVVDAERVLR